MSQRAIKNAAQMMDEMGLTEITTEESAFWGLVKEKIHLSKQNVVMANAATGTSNAVEAPQRASSAAVEPAAGTITSPMVGVIYLSPEPDSKPFISVGQRVTAGTTICLVEAMKTFNPIKAPRDGVISEILVKDGETVEFGTALVVLK